jgi:hypothetical protein
MGACMDVSLNEDGSPGTVAWGIHWQDLGANVDSDMRPACASKGAHRGHAPAHPGVLRVH